MGGIVQSLNYYVKKNLKHPSKSFQEGERGNTNRRGISGIKGAAVVGWHDRTNN
jgi:hypothetical protein